MMQRDRLRLARVRDWLWRDGLPVLIFALAALAALYPVLPAMRWRILGWSGDNIQYVYMTGRVAEALSQLQSVFTDPRLNFPGILWLPATDAPFLSMLFAAPAVWLFTPVLGYNLIMLVSSLLSGYVVYLWLRRVLGSRFAAVIAGLAFELAAYRVAHSFGHLQLISTQALPLFFWCLDRVVVMDANPISVQQTLGRYLCLALASMLVGAMSQYYLVICCLCAVPYVLFSGAGLRRMLTHGWRWAAALVCGGALSALPYLLTARELQFRPYVLNETRVWSANPLDFIMPSPLHPIWGAWIHAQYPRETWIEHTLYLGVVALLLAGVATAACLVRRRAAQLMPSAVAGSGVLQSQTIFRLTLCWLGVAAASIMLALGTDLHAGLLSQPVSQENPVWLPSYYLAKLPGVSLMRVWARFGVITALFLAMLAGVGAFWLRRLLPRPALLILLLLLCLDIAPGRLGHIDVLPRPIDRWLAQQPGDFAVAELPPGANNYVAMLGSLTHQKRLPAFNHPSHLTAEFQSFAERADGFPSAEAQAQLARLNVRYVLVDLHAYESTLGITAADMKRQIAAAGLLTEVATTEDNYVVYQWDVR
jgi:hypothetical protein